MTLVNKGHLKGYIELINNNLNYLELLYTFPELILFCFLCRNEHASNRHTLIGVFLESSICPQDLLQKSNQFLDSSAPTFLYGCSDLSRCETVTKNDNFLFLNKHIFKNDRVYKKLEARNVIR